MEFSLAAVLGVVTGHNFEAPGDRDSMQPLLSHMLGRDVRKAEIVNVIDECRDELRKQFPRLGGTRFLQAVRMLNLQSDKAGGPSQRMEIHADFIGTQLSAFKNDFLSVSPMGVEEFADV